MNKEQAFKVIEVMCDKLNNLKDTATFDELLRYKMSIKSMCAIYNILTSENYRLAKLDIGVLDKFIYMVTDMERQD